MYITAILNRWLGTLNARGEWTVSFEQCPKCTMPLTPHTLDGKRVVTYLCHNEDTEYYVCNLAGKRKILGRAEFMRLKREMNG